jgi:hypothetical protein
MRDSALAQAVHDLLRGLLAREFAEVLLDVLNLQRARVERVLLDQILQTRSMVTREFYNAPPDPF